MFNLEEFLLKIKQYAGDSRYHWESFKDFSTLEVILVGWVPETMPPQREDGTFEDSNTPILSKRFTIPWSQFKSVKEALKKLSDPVGAEFINMIYRLSKPNSSREQLLAVLNDSRFEIERVQDVSNAKDIYLVYDVVSNEPKVKIEIPWKVQ